MVLKLAGPLNNHFENYNTNNKRAAIIQKNANSPVICKKKTAISLFFLIDVFREFGRKSTKNKFQILFETRF